MIEFLQAIGTILVALAQGATTIWASLDTRWRLILVITAFLAFVYWFYDGVKNWRRKCLPCSGRGSFSSKISKRLDRPCKCCGGAGRHTSIRKRIASRMSPRTKSS